MIGENSCKLKRYAMNSNGIRTNVGGWLVVLSLLLVSGVAQAKVANVSLEQLVRGSGFIGMVKVQSLVTNEHGKIVATGKVLATWKGEVAKTVKFHANKEFGDCDLTTGLEGETIILFSKETAFAEVLTISHAGRGRLPVQSHQGTWYAGLPVGLDLPEAVVTVKAEKGTGTLVKVSELKAEVMNIRAHIPVPRKEMQGK